MQGNFWIEKTASDLGLLQQAGVLDDLINNCHTFPNRVKNKWECVSRIIGGVVTRAQVELDRPKSNSVALKSS
jgi:hypothetical protein